MTASPRLKLRLSPAAEKAVRRGHPWVFADRIRDRNREGTGGELAVVYDRHDRFLAVGLFDPDSPIALRVLHAGTPTRIDDAWWQKHLERPIAHRRALFRAAETTGYRCVNGESDGWPGLVLDRYGDAAVVKLYTAAWLPHLQRITRLVQSVLAPSRLVLRLSRNIQAIAAGTDMGDGQMLIGDRPSGPVLFQENGLSFEADVLRGQKTGFFLDQRENRQRVRELSRGRRVLNLFSHAGGFSVYAAAGGATSTLDLDLSEHALASARRNMSRNQTDPQAARCVHSTVKADAFPWLAQQPGGSFDLMVIDPPSLARRASEKPGALASYAKLSQEGARLLRPDGILVSASCSAHVTTEEFFEVVRHAATRVDPRIQEMETRRHAPDHPARIPEAHYLKCIYLRRPQPS